MELFSEFCNICYKPDDETDCPISISTECHKIINSSADINMGDSELNRVIKNLKSERKDCEFDGDYSDESVINSVAECYETRVAFTNVKDMKIATLRRSERESGNEFDACDVNNGKESNTVQIEFVKKEFGVNNERERSDLNFFTMQHFGNECGGHVNLPVVNISEGSVDSGTDSTTVELHVKEENDASENLELEKIAFEFVNVCTTMTMQDCEEDVKVEIKLPSTSCNSKSIAGGINMQDPHMSEQWNSGGTTTRLHKLADSNGTRHTCAVCKKTFTRSVSLTVHERTHSGYRPYRCTYCNKAFTCSANLTAHVRIHTGDRPYKCTVCSKAFAQLFGLISHERTHSGARPYKCTFCNKAFARPSTLTVHKRTHIGDTPYKCTVCYQAFRRSADLTAHEPTHTGDRPYKCTVCNNTFTDIYTLTRHARIHSDDRSYKCCVCNKAFRIKSNLTTHERIHTGERPYPCTVCIKAFTHLSTLLSHKRTHSGARPYKCTVCTKTFTQSSGLSAHERTHK